MRAGVRLRRTRGRMELIRPRVTRRIASSEGMDLQLRPRLEPADRFEGGARPRARRDRAKATSRSPRSDGPASTPRDQDEAANGRTDCRHWQAWLKHGRFRIIMGSPTPACAMTTQGASRSGRRGDESPRSTTSAAETPGGNRNWDYATAGSAIRRSCSGALVNARTYVRRQKEFFYFIADIAEARRVSSR